MDRCPIEAPRAWLHRRLKADAQWKHDVIEGELLDQLDPALEGDHEHLDRAVDRLGGKEPPVPRVFGQGWQDLGGDEEHGDQEKTDQQVTMPLCEWALP